MELNFQLVRYKTVLASCNIDHRLNSFLLFPPSEEESFLGLTVLKGNCETVEMFRTANSKRIKCNYSL